MDSQLKLPALARLTKTIGLHLWAMQEAVVKSREPILMKAGNNPQCEADREAHRLGCVLAKHYFPDLPILSEEGTPQEHEFALKAKKKITLDPLDDTVGYLLGRKCFSVNAGIIDDGVATEGAIYFPGRKELYFTYNGGAYLQKNDDPPQQIHVRQLSRNPLVVTTGRNGQNLDHLGAHKTNVIRQAAQYRACTIARGKADISSVHNPGYKVWDIAPSDALMTAAGGKILTRDGNMNYNTLTLPKHIFGSVDAFKFLGIAGKEVTLR